MNSYDPSNWEVEARGSRIQLHTKFEVLLCYMRSYLKSTIIIINNNNNNTMVADTLLKTVGCIPCRLASLCSTVQKLQVLCVLPVDSADSHPRAIFTTLVCVTC